MTIELNNHYILDAQGFQHDHYTKNNKETIAFRPNQHTQKIQSHAIQSMTLYIYEQIPIEQSSHLWIS